MNHERVIWLSASIAEGATIYLPQPTVGANQPGSLGEQLAVADLAARNPWNFVDPADAMRAARRTILHHARRATIG